jgi:3-deoxy-D-manno-octulosonic-acid transferase
METELWPNTLHAAKKHNIPVTIINARLSKRSFKRYQKFPFIFSLLFKNITAIYCQTNEDAQRFIALGVKPQNVQVTGSIKFDISIPNEINKKADKLRSALGTNRPIWIAASTHQGEDEQILTAHHKLLARLPNALLILVPRHPERFLAVIALANARSFNTVNRTSNNEFTATDNVYIADTMGEMLLLIGASDICFMGGSLIGSQVGGHNLLEPASLSKPCLIGPSFYNFKLITDQLVANKGAIICQNTEDISNQLILLFVKPEKMKAMGINALATVNKNRGALEKTLKSLLHNF